jgi:hypothetical protein
MRFSTFAQRGRTSLLAGFGHLVRGIFDLHQQLLLSLSSDVLGQMTEGLEKGCRDVVKHVGGKLG